MDRMETRLSKEIEARQAAELRRREVEIAQRALSVSHQQLQEELAQVSSQLQSEKEAKQLQESLYKKQLDMFQTLQDESKKAEDQKCSFISRLQAADTTKHSLEEKLVEMTKRNTQLEVQVATVMQKSEADIERLKERLTETSQKQVRRRDSP